jgi:hypothetical protein
MSKFIVLCPLEGMIQMAQSQWSRTLSKAGHEVKTVNLRSKGLDPILDLPRLVREILEFNPQCIFVEALLGFNLAEFYHDPNIQKIPIGAFWFDDPYRSIAHLKTDDPYFDLLRLNNIQHFVWDGYWRDWLDKRYKIKSHPIHLAADPEEFFPIEKKKEYPDAIVFIGTLVRQDRLTNLKDHFVPVVKNIGETFEREYQKSSYGTPTYTLLEEVISSLPPKLSKAYLTLVENNSSSIKQLHAYVWMYGKNETRKRILKTALKRGPLLMLSANLEKTQPSQDELKETLGSDNCRLIYQDTSAFENNLSEIYNFGKLHIQTTDPQSIFGGIPFRVFQTAACARPLLTDKKAELGECFEYEKEILTFNSEEDFCEKLESALVDSNRLEEIAERGYQRFLKEHTWAQRMETVVKLMKA